jgi:hypothetical protein
MPTDNGDKGQDTTLFLLLTATMHVVVGIGPKQRLGMRAESVLLNKQCS